jgi:NAD(P)-dependent dehydrogenase (short-subunit alcohol dehydrogenase family)
VSPQVEEAMNNLEGKVAVVAGATRGAGRGIACSLGDAGATVYCTGRSVRGKPATKGRPETIEETAELVTERGGHGIHMRVDHTRPKEVQALFERIREEQGRLDILVNDVWGGDALTEFGKTFWQHSLSNGLTMLERAVHSHMITSHFGAPLLIETGAGLIVEITDGDNYGYRGNLFYDLVKTSVIRIAFGMARELKKTGVVAIALTPGYLRSEAMLDLYGVTEANWRDAAEKDPNFLASETPFYVGRAVVALATDPEVKRKTGRVFSSWGLAVEYGFKDVDGRQPNWGEHFEKTYAMQIPSCDDAFYAHWEKSPFDAVFPDWP